MYRITIHATLLTGAAPVICHKNAFKIRDVKNCQSRNIAVLPDQLWVGEVWAPHQYRGLFQWTVVDNILNDRGNLIGVRQGRRLSRGRHLGGGLWVGGSTRGGGHWVRGSTQGGGHGVGETLQVGDIKGIDRPFRGKVKSSLIRSLFINWRLGNFFLLILKGFHHKISRKPMEAA
jgi:hypothetical protein